MKLSSFEVNCAGSKKICGVLFSFVFAGFALNSFSSCKQRSFNSSKPEAAAASAPIELDQKTYIAACEKEVGPLPETLSCFDSAKSREITIWTLSGGKTVRIGHEVDFKSDMKCDNPSPDFRDFSLPE
jgi:hypothetical protein